jgi:hypothetical protein
MRHPWIALLLLIAACGGGRSASTNTSPSSITATPTPVPAVWALTGTVSDTVTGTPVVGAVLTFADLEAVTTDGSGQWALRRSGTPAATLRVEVKAPAYLDRQVNIRWDKEGRSGLSIDIIRDAAPFSLGFYRKLVRNDYDEPGQLQQTRRWTTVPNFYINTFNPRTGRDILPSEIDLMVRTIRNAVPQATAGRYQAGVIETGSGDRTLVPGFINVEITYEPEANYCGRANVGANPGRIWINYDRCANECGDERISPRTLTHEIGHGMGFWHHDQGGVMDSIAHRGACGVRDFSALEKYHAALLYSRPVGNTDIDADRAASVLLTDQSDAPVVTCFR